MKKILTVPNYKLKLVNTECETYWKKWSKQVDTHMYRDKRKEIALHIEWKK